MKITSPEMLRNLADHRLRLLAVRLGGGLIASKEIWFGGRKFHIMNGTDGTEDTMTMAEVRTDPLLGLAMLANCLELDEPAGYVPLKMRAR